MYGCMPTECNNNLPNGVKSMFYINVKDLMHTLLPRPKKKNSLDDDRAESLDQLPIIKIRCDLNEVEGFYTKF